MLSAARSTRIASLIEKLKTGNSSPSITTELQQIVDLQGDKARVQILQLCIRTAISDRSVPDSISAAARALLTDLSRTGSAYSVVCTVLENAFPKLEPEQKLQSWLSKLKLEPASFIFIGIAGLSSIRSDVNAACVALLKEALVNLASKPVALPIALAEQSVALVLGDQLFDSSSEVNVQQIVEALLASSSELKAAPTHPYLAGHRSLVDPADLASLKDIDSLSKRLLTQIDISGYIMDFGYSCTKSCAAFRRALASLGRGADRDLIPLNDGEVARVLVRMATTLSGLDSGAGATWQAGLADTGGHAKDLPAEADDGVPATTWNPRVVADVLSTDFSLLDWHRVVRALDFPGCDLSDPEAFAFVVRACRAATRDAVFPVEEILQPWENAAAQMTCIARAIQAPEDLITFRHLRCMAPVEDSPNGVGSPNHAWTSIALYEALLRLALQGGLGQQVQPLLHEGVKSCSELVLLGLAHCRADAGHDKKVQDPHKVRGRLFEQLFRMTFGAYFEDIAHRPPKPMWLAVIKRMWEISRPLVVLSLGQLSRLTPAPAASADVLPNKGPVRGFHAAQESVTRVVALVRTLPGVVDVFATPQLLTDFTIDFVVFMSMQQQGSVQQLEQWLRNASATAGILETFVTCCVRYLQRATVSHKCLIQARAEGQPTDARKPIPVAAVLAVAAVTRSLQTSLPASSVAEVGLVVDQVLQLFPSQGGPGASGATDAASDAKSAERDSELESSAQQLFKRVYDEEVSIDEMIEILRSYMSSSESDKVTVYKKIVHSALDEFRFLDCYPDKQLRIGGILYGNLVLHNLLSGEMLMSSLYQLLVFLKHEAKTAMFALIAINVFKQLLPQAPAFAQVIGSMAFVKKQSVAFASDLEALGHAAGTTPLATPFAATATHAARRFLHEVMRAQPAPATAPAPQHPAQGVGEPAPGAAAKPTSTAATRPTGTAAAARPSVDVVKPPESVKDKLNQVLNQLDEKSVKSRSASLRSVLEPQYYPWIGRYLAINRVATQPNLHQLYFEFLQEVGGDQLLREVIRPTLETVVGHLKRGKHVASSTERTLIKNLGKWLGRITLARNIPILQKDLDLKDLLLQAYEEAALVGYVPFLTNLLEWCNHPSSVFRPPNPWTMGILRVLREIFELHPKGNVWFSIDELLKTLQQSDIQPSNLLRFRRRPIKTDDFKAEIKLEQLPGIPAVDTSKTKIKDLAKYVTIDMSLYLFRRFRPLTSYVVLAMDSTITTIAKPVVDRSATIACMTAKQLVLKDFAAEGDPRKVITAAQLMAGKLAASLALVTCQQLFKDSLRGKLTAAFSKLLAGAAREEDIAEAVTTCTDNNVELGRSYIERQAREKAVHDIGANISQSINRRKEAQEAGQNFQDTEILQASPWTTRLPEPLRPTSGLSRSQLMVYDAYGSRPDAGTVKQAAATHTAAPPAFAATPAPHAAAGADARGPALPQPAPAARTGPDGVAFAQGPMPVPDPARTVLSGDAALSQYVRSLDILVQQARAVGEQEPSKNALSMLRKDHPIMRLFPEIRHIGKMTNPADRDRAGITFAVQVLHRMYENATFAAQQHSKPGDPLLLQAYMALLVTLRETCSQQLQQELTNQVMKQPKPGDPNFLRDIPVTLLRSSLLVPRLYDEHLAAAVQGNRGAAEFGMHVVNRLIIQDRILQVVDLSKTTRMLFALAKEAAPIAADAAHEATPSPQQAFAIALTKTVEQLRRMMLRAEQSSTAAADVISPSFGERLLTQDRRGLHSKEQREQVARLLATWLKLSASVVNGLYLTSEIEQNFVAHLREKQVLASEDTLMRFLRLATEISVESSIMSSATGLVPSPASHPPPVSIVSYTVPDGLVRLFMLLVTMSDIGARPKMIEKLFGTIRDVLRMDAERATHQHHAIMATNVAPRGLQRFDQRPYLRIFSGLLRDLFAMITTASVEPATAMELKRTVLHVFAMVLDSIHPTEVPSFGVAWLELFAHKLFLGELLSLEGKAGWSIFQRLLVQLLRFLFPHLQNGTMSAGIRTVYKGLLRIMVVLVNDFPDFLAENHFVLCNYIPGTCVQLRNIVVSAFPRDHKLPNPCAPDLKIDRLPTIGMLPPIPSDLQKALSLPAAGVDKFVLSGTPSHFPSTILSKMYVAEPAASLTPSKFSHTAVNTLVLYVAHKAIYKHREEVAGEGGGSGQATLVSSAWIRRSYAMDIYRTLCREMPPDGRALLLNAMANHLRYPNAHMHFVMCVLLTLFAEADGEGLKEQIVRVLAERLSCQQPLPWGTIVTYIELLRNPQYNLWGHAFAKDEEVQAFLKSVERNCTSQGAPALLAPGSAAPSTSAAAVSATST